MKQKSSRLPDRRLNRQIVDEASAWFVDFRVGDIGTGGREEFSAWLRRSPDHIQAYLDIARTYAELPAIEGHGAIDIQQLIADARSNLGENIVSLPSPLHPRTGETRGKARFFALAATVAIVALGAALSTWLYTQRNIYSTGIGEQRSVTLDDGSIVELNALSRVHIRLGKHERDVDLLAGQALFSVAHDKTRPFIVRSGATQIRAVGTQFDVYRKKTGTTVTVIEGRVAVTSALPATKEETASRPRETQKDEDETFLTAGEQVNVISTALPHPTHANIQAATAWTQRQLIFDNNSLMQVAEEFNRYSPRRMIVDATRLQDFHVSGVYSSSNTESLLRFLRAQPAIAVQETSDEIQITAR